MKARIAQLVEQLAFNQLVLGSSPSPRTSFALKHFTRQSPKIKELTARVVGAFLVKSSDFRSRPYHRASFIHAEASLVGINPC
jgi:hypothetical protein